MGRLRGLWPEEERSQMRNVRGEGSSQQREQPATTISSVSSGRLELGRGGGRPGEGI